MLNGKGDQAVLTASYEEDRQRALLDRTKFSADELGHLEIESWQGINPPTNLDINLREQHPFPTESSPGTYDVREARPELGETSDVGL